MCKLFYNSKWHQDLPSQAHSEEFGEGMLSKLVRDKAKNTGSVTVEEVENHDLLLKVGAGWVCKTFPRTWYTGCNND